MDSESFLEELLRGPLKSRGFTKARLAWHRQLEEVVHVLSFQRSAWGGDNYYVNVGVYLRDLGDEPRPAENRCHVRARVESMPNALSYAYALDFEEQLEQRVREEALLSLIMKAAVPWFESMTDARQVRARVVSDPGVASRTSVHAKKFFGLALDE